MVNIVSTGKTISTSQYLERRNRERRRKRLILCALLLAFLAALVVVSRLPSLQIKSVSVSGAEATGSDAVAASVEESLSGRYLWLIPKSNALIYGKGAIKKNLSSRFPRLNSIALSLEGLNKLNVSVGEREPFALYCESGDCWFMDQEGFIFGTAPNFSEGVYFEFRSVPALAEPLGGRFLPQGEFAAVRGFVTALSPLGFEPLHLAVASDHMVIGMAGGSRLFLGKESDLSRALTNLRSFLESPEIKAQKDFLARVSELDLRTEDKVFYRFK